MHVVAAGTGRCVGGRNWDRSTRVSRLSPKVAVQVDCTPPGDLVVRVLDFRASDDGYLKLTPWNAAGVGAVSAIGLRSSSSAVRVPSGLQGCPPLVIMCAQVR